MSITHGNCPSYHTAYSHSLIYSHLSGELTSELADISKSCFGSVLPLKKLCCFSLIDLGDRRQGQALPLAGCAARLTEQFQGRSG